MPKKAETNETAQRNDSDGTRSIDVVNNRLESRDLFLSTREVTIGHAGEVYRLRLTALNKLILTK